MSGVGTHPARLTAGAEAPAHHDYVRHGTATLFAALVIRAGSFTSVRELLRDMEDYLAERNAAPIRYVWKAQGAEILEKIRRARAALAHVQAA